MLVEPLELRVLLSAQLIEDLWPGRNTSPVVREAVAFNGQTYFAVHQTGVENAARPGIWRTDGTAAGTALVAPGIFHNLDVANGSLWATGKPDPSDDHWNVYRMDPSHALARLTDASAPGEDYVGKPWFAPLGDLTLFNATVYSPSPRERLFASRGTAATTVDIGPAAMESGFVRSGPYQYFIDTPLPAELWRTDGTAAGTVPVAPGVVPVSQAVDAAMTDLNGSLLFMGRDEASGFGLWKTDGTTTEFLHPFAIEDAYSGSGMVAWNGRVYFRASDARGDAELWATDGTPAGTVRVKDINDAPYAYYGSYPDELTVFGGALYFRAQGPNYQPTEVWRTDGTEAGTVRVTDTGPAFGPGRVVHILGATDSALFYSANDGTSGVELWRTDGTPGGTVRVEDISPGVGSSYPGYVEVGPPPTRPVFVAHPGRLDFAAYNEVYGTELWTTDDPQPARAAVVARHVFYNGSSFDGNDPAASQADDGAIAADKAALLPGHEASFANVTSYDKGLNGVMIDVADLPPGGALSPGDFDFGASAPAASVAVRRGAGEAGSDRVTLLWTDFSPLAKSPTLATANGWITVTMKANSNTGLAAPDVFSFGNLAGETGDGTGATVWRVNALDLGAVKQALNSSGQITSTTDVNRDGRTNALDLGIVKRNLNRLLPPPDPATAFATPAVALAAPMPDAPTPNPTRRMADDLLL